MKETGFNKTKTCSASGGLKPQTLGRILFSIVLGAFPGYEACGGGAYLPCVGPPGLRFETIPVPSPSSAMIFTLSVPKDNFAAIRATEPHPPATNSILTAASSVNIANSPENVSGGSNPIIPMPATDDSVVMPQMLLDYLRPTAHGAVFVPINFGFIPPVPVIIQPSRAVYKSQ
jgi:hypothetical protein